MADKKIIAVLGATGAQGGGLVRAIMEDPDGGFTARALTRNPESDKARELAALGAEVVAVDVDDPQSLKAAFDGAYGAFCVTFFWEHFSPEKELAQVRSMAEAARSNGLKHVIWSTLEDTRKWVPLSDSRMPTLQGNYKVPHFDAKGEANALFTEAGVPTTFLQTSFYWDNLIHFGMGPRADENGNLGFALPMGDTSTLAARAGSPGIISRAPKWRPSSVRPTESRWPTSRFRSTFTGGWISRARTTWGTCSSSSTTSRTTSPEHGISRLRAL
jgi:uncharacterized protein YbjT (DUF2867 family)